ncbi:MAG: hypothetical protein HQK86_08835 [Nitrospinae bacterium]|nr:hypothetical protein [Nitrospinota bacterium]MBF0635376.1 hypothetical protein [Nitrospinota bacterium]
MNKGVLLDHCAVAQDRSGRATGRKANWLEIEAEYRAGEISIMEIGRRHGVTDTAIRKKARQKGWVRDASGVKREMVKSHLAGVSGKSSEGSSVSELIRTSAMTDIEVMEAGAELYALIVKDLNRQVRAKTETGGLDPKEAKTIADAAGVAIEKYRLIKGLNDPKSDDGHEEFVRWAKEALSDAA